MYLVLVSCLGGLNLPGNKPGQTRIIKPQPVPQPTWQKDLRLEPSLSTSSAGMQLKRAVLYRIGLPSNTATPLALALFGGSLRIELHSSSIHTNRATMLRSTVLGT